MKQCVLCLQAAVNNAVEGSMVAPVAAAAAASPTVVGKAKARAGSAPAALAMAPPATPPEIAARRKQVRGLVAPTPTSSSAAAAAAGLHAGGGGLYVAVCLCVCVHACACLPHSQRLAPESHCLTRFPESLDLNQSPNPKRTLEHYGYPYTPTPM